MSPNCAECNRLRNHVTVSDTDFTRAAHQRMRANTYETIRRADNQLTEARKRRDMERQTFLIHQLTHIESGE